MYARVPDTGDGADRVSSQRQRYPRGRGPDGSNSNHRQHRSMTSSVAFTTDSSAPGTSSGSVPLATVGHPGQASSCSAGRVCYREQGVDGLLQLKFLQEVTDVDASPTGSTIVWEMLRYHASLLSS